MRARGAGFIGFCLIVVGAFLALVSGAGAIGGWFTIVSFVTLDPRTGERRVPERLWIVVVATTGAVLLIGAAATLLFNVATRFYDRGARHAADADFTRNIETAIRVTIAAKGPKQDEPRDAALDRLAASLIRHPDSEQPSSETELRSTLSTVVGELGTLLELLKKVKEG